MKTKLIAFLATSLPAFGQGTIQLSNANLPGPAPGSVYDAVINIAGFEGNGFPDDLPGDYGEGFWLAGLFREGSNTPLVTTTFFSGTGENAQYNWIFANEPQVAVPGIAPGQTGRFFVGVWRASAGFNQFPTGQSAVFTSRPLGGPNPTPGELPFTTPVTTFQGFTILTPEPGTAALVALGLGAFLLRRRKQSLP